MMVAKNKGFYVISFDLLQYWLNNIFNNVVIFQLWAIYVLKGMWLENSVHLITVGD